MKAARNNGRQRALFPLDMTSWHWRDREQYPGTTREHLVGLRTGQHRLKGRPVTGNDSGGSSCQRADNTFMEQLDTLICGTSLPFSFSLFPSVLPYTSEQRKTRFIHLGDEDFLTQLLYENTVTVTRTTCFYTSFPRVQEAQRKATTHKTHRMAGTPDFVTSISHTWYWDCILINACFRALQMALQVMSRTTPGGAVYVDYTVNGDCGVMLPWKSCDLQSMVLGICWLPMYFVKRDYIFPSSMLFYG